MQSQELPKLKIPDKSGVYTFKGPGVIPVDAGIQVKGSGSRIKPGMTNTILYIGKATSLRDRVKSYFGKDLIVTRGPHLVDMVTKSSTIDWQETDSVLEALILEATLIKKHQPYYNTKEKDDKSWNYVCITKELIPKVLVMRGKELLHRQDLWGKNNQKLSFSRVFGPFTNGNQLREAMKIVRRIFPYIDASSSKKQNYEFYRQLGLAPSLLRRGGSYSRRGGDLELENHHLPLTGTPPQQGGEEHKSLQEYKRNIRNIKLFFEGKKKKILQSLKKEMMALAKVREFERAGEVKRQIFALNHINDVALLKSETISSRSDLGLSRGPTFSRSFRIEAYDVAHMSGKNMVGVMTVVENGQAQKSDYRKFIIRSQSGSNDTGALSEILDRRLGHPEWRYPNLIVVDGSTAQINTAEKILDKYGMKIPVVSVVKDDRHRAKGIKSSRPSQGGVAKGRGGNPEIRDHHPSQSNTRVAPPQQGGEELASQHESAILLANSEAHRFAITFHKAKRARNFLR